MGPLNLPYDFQDYLDLLGAVDGLLLEQAKMDARSFTRATGRTLDAAQIAAQHAGYRHTFLVYGKRAPSFVEVLGSISREGATSVSQCASKPS